MELNTRNVALWSIGKVAYDAYKEIEKDYDKVVLEDTSVETMRDAFRRANSVFMDTNGMLRKVYKGSEVADLEWLQRATTWSNMKYEECVQHIRASREFVIMMDDL